MGEIRCMPQGFKPNVAAELGNLVIAAYDQFQPKAGRPPKWPLSAPYQLLAEFSAAPPTKGPEKFGFVARRTDTGDVYVVFRGTQTLGDWLANVDFVQVAQKNGWGRAEKGFSGVYNGTTPSITDVLRSNGSPTHLYVTGHSLGGSLATLCTADVRATLGATTTLYAFASPRTGDLDFADQFNTRCPDTWRIVNSEDIVNTVPLATASVEQLNLSGLQIVAQHLDNIPFLPEKAKQAVARVRSLFNGGNFEHVGTSVDFTQHNGTIVANHDMATYLAALGVKIDTPLAQTAAASRG